MIFTIHNRNTEALPEADRLRLWVDVGDRIVVAPGHILHVDSEAEDGEPRDLVLRLQSPAGEYVIRDPESLSFYTTEALIRCVATGAEGVERVLIDIGPMAIAPHLNRDVNPAQASLPVDGIGQG
jgi:hypothetical protein